MSRRKDVDLVDVGDKYFGLQPIAETEAYKTGRQRRHILYRILSFCLGLCTVALVSIMILVLGGGRLASLGGFADAAWAKISVSAQSLSVTEWFGAEDREEAGEGEQTDEAEPDDGALATQTIPTPPQTMSGSSLVGSMEPRVAQVTPSSEGPGFLFEEAETAFAQEAWEEAIARYTALRAEDETYESATVTEHLALSYRNAALALLEADSASDVDLETARRYLREALRLTPDDGVAAEENALLTSYLAGVRSLQFEEPAEAIDALLQVYDIRPDYLNGRAAEQLYNAYVALGDVAYRRGETGVARNTYERAAALNLPGLDAADVRLQSMQELLELTPTPYPLNLATVQAAAAVRGLPPVLLATPTPASPTEADERAAYATAVAVTTGTFTPEPEAYVTPFLVVPSPPAESVATEAARAIMATAEAGDAIRPTSTPLPYNAVIGEYVYATPLPENAATAEARAVIAEADKILKGTPTPLPWNAIVITPVPTPAPPTSTPIPTSTPLPLVVPESVLTPTPTPVPTMSAPESFPPELRNKIVFKSDRGGNEQTYMLDPDSGEISLITQEWVHPMAQERLGLSPDGNREAVVLADSNRVLQIQIRDYEYDTTRQLTSVNRDLNPNAIAYDPAWSPGGERIAYVTSETGGDEIYTVNVDDGSTRRLTDNSWEWDKHPTWSPDGSQIVFYSNRESGRRQLWIMDADGANQRSLSNNEYNDWDPVWIP